MNPNQRKLQAINNNGHTKPVAKISFEQVAAAAGCPVKTAKAICEGQTSGFAPHVVQAVNRVLAAR